MVDKKINELLQKYYEGKTSEDEEKELFIFSKNQDGLEDFKMLDEKYEYFENEKLKKLGNSFDNLIVNRIRFASRYDRRYLLRSDFLLRVAAAFLLAISTFSIGYFTGQTRKMNESSNDLSELKTELNQLKAMSVLTLISQESANSRLKGIILASQVIEPKEELLHQLIGIIETDENSSVRMAAVESMQPFLNIPFINQKLIGSISKQPSILVQLKIIEMIYKPEKGVSKEGLMELLNEPAINTNVKTEIKKMIQTL